MKKAFLIFFLYILTFSVHASLFHVNPSNGGSDANSGFSGAPWATIQHAATMAGAGDTVYVQAGTYAEKVTFANSGTQNNIITFIGVGTVTVEAPANTTVWSGTFNLNTKSYIRIQNFFIQNAYWFGIYVESCDHIYVENNKTYNTGASGISVWHSSYVYAAHNVVRKACYQSLSTGSQECITFSSVANFEIHDNEISESGGSTNGGEGIDTKEACSYGKVYNNTVHDLNRLGIYADSWDKLLQYVDIYNNKVFNCSEGITVSSENGGTVDHVNIYNNVVYNNNDFGINVSAYVLDGPRHNIAIMNNTVYNNGYNDNNTGWGGGIIVYSANISNISIFNNIVSQNDAMQITDKSGTAEVSVNKNLIYGYRGLSWTNEVKGTNVIESNPLFADADGADNISGNADDNLNVTMSSPAINAGTNTGTPAFDYNYDKRPAEGTADIGAYESNSIPLAVKNPVIYISEEPLVLIYPNPGNGVFNLKAIRKIDRIEIMNSSGGLVQSYTAFPDALIQISIADAGLYVVRVYAGDVCRTYKVIRY